MRDTYELRLLATLAEHKPIEWTGHTGAVMGRLQAAGLADGHGTITNKGRSALWDAMTPHEKMAEAVRPRHGMTDMAKVREAARSAIERHRALCEAVRPLERIAESYFHEGGNPLVIDRAGAKLDRNQLDRIVDLARG